MNVGRVVKYSQVRVSLRLSKGQALEDTVNE